MPELESEILIYNFKTIDVEKINLNIISDDNPLKLVFKMAKTLLETNSEDEYIYETKIKLAEELVNYNKVKNNEQIKALVDFLEYLFLIQSPELEEKYQNYKKEKGGALKMTVDQIRKLHYKQEGKEEERKLIIMKQYSKGFSVEYIAEINEFDVEYVRDILKNNTSEINN